MHKEINQCEMTNYHSPFYPLPLTLSFSLSRCSSLSIMLGLVSLQLTLTILVISERAHITNIDVFSYVCTPPLILICALL